MVQLRRWELLDEVLDGGAPVEVDAHWVIGADGLRSRVARSVGAPVVEARPAGGAVQYAYYEGIPWNGFEFFVAGRSLPGCSRPTTGRRASGSARPRPSRDAVTAYGISDAFRDAELLAVALDQALAEGAEEAAALAGYQRQRDRALREVFELTCRLAAYPPVPAFVELQKRLGAAIDTQAALAARPVPAERLLATA